MARGNSTQFLDKPWIAVDIPRFGGRTCNISVPQANGSVIQTVPAGNVYVAYADIATVNGVTTSTIYFSRSLDCGQTWSTPIAYLFKVILDFRWISTETCASLLDAWSVPSHSCMLH